MNTRKILGRLVGPFVLLSAIWFAATGHAADKPNVVLVITELDKGRTQLRTWLIDAKSQKSRGAYYVSVKR